MTMDFVSRYFDHYIISARIKPAFFIVLPLAVTALVWWPDIYHLGSAILAFLVTFGAVGFLSNLISNKGNELQAQLFAEWGGVPTVTILRFSDSQLDVYTKERYHKQLEMIVPGLVMPTPQQEITDPLDADDHYASATHFLREHTRDKEKYPMIYSDNVAYGYARNLLAMKSWGVTFAMLSVIVNLVFLYPGIKAALTLPPYALSHQSLLGFGALGICVIMLWQFCIVVNMEYVKGRAIRYSKSLLASCEVGFLS